jgi:hypothetical protein
MQNQNRRQRFDIRLSRHRTAGPVEIGEEGFRGGEMAEGIGDGADVSVLNVELEGSVGFEGDAVLVAWFTED